MSKFNLIMPTVDILIYPTTMFNTFHPVVNSYGGNMPGVVEIGFCYKTDAINNNLATINNNVVALGYGNGTFETDILLDSGCVDFQIFNGAFMFRAYARYGNTVVYGNQPAPFQEYAPYEGMMAPTISCDMNLFENNVVVSASFHMNTYWGEGSNQTDDHKWYLYISDSLGKQETHECTYYDTVYPIEFVPSVRPTWVSAFVEYYVNGQRYYGVGSWYEYVKQIYRP